MKSILFSAAALISLTSLTSLSALAADPGITDSQILIGSVNATTGPAGPKAQQVQRGSEIVFKKVNAAGGVHGRKIEVTTLDSGNDPKTGLQHTEKLAKETKVFAFFQFFGSGVVKTAMTVIDRDRIPLIAPIASDEHLRTPLKRDIFPVNPSTQSELSALVKFATQKLGVKKFGLLYSDNSYGSAGRLAVLANLHKEAGLKLAGEARFSQKEPDYNAAVDALQKAGVEAVIFAAQADEAGAFMKAAAGKEFKTIYLGGAPLATGQMLGYMKELKADVYFTLRFPLLSNKSSELVKMYLKDAQEVGEKPDPAQLEGYVGAQVLVEGLKRAGKDLSRASLVKALETMSDFSVGEIPIRYSSTSHDGSSSLFLGKATKDGFESTDFSVK